MVLAGGCVSGSGSGFAPASSGVATLQHGLNQRFRVYGSGLGLLPTTPCVLVFRGLTRTLARRQAQSYEVGIRVYEVGIRV